MPTQKKQTFFLKCHYQLNVQEYSNNNLHVILLTIVTV